MSKEEQKTKEVWVTKTQVVEHDVFIKWQEAVKKLNKTYKRALKEAMELWIKEYIQK